MSTTIDSLEIRIDTSAGSSAVNIERLATALGSLKANSKLTTVVNNLNKLSTALDKLNASSGSLTGINQLATSLQSLSGVDVKGFKSAITALGRIPKILDSLDSATLEKFKKKMEEVAKALKPLATQIDKVANGFARLPSRIKSVVTATNNASNATKKFGGTLSSLDLFATIQNMQELVGAINFVADALSAALSQAIEWDGIQFRFGRAFGEDAEETYDYILKINEALGINIQEFMQYSSLYGSLLSGFGMAQEKVTTISVGLTELSYDIWAAYNDRFKSLEDASEAVRSAITGEIEPIRNAGIALTEASLQEFIDSTHLAGVSIEKLTEAQKSEVRYAAMVNAAMNQGIVGTYAREMNTAEGAVRSLSQSMKTLVQAFGSLFIPILQVVVPYVTAFVEILTDAVFWVAKLFGIEMFKIDWSNTSKGVGGLADGATEAATGLGKASKAAKKLKDYTMGFDELNVISPDTPSASGGGSGVGAGGSGWGEGLDLDTLWDDSVFEQASKRVDEIKQNILDFADKWKWAFALAGVALTGFMGHKAWSYFKDTALFAGLVKAKDFLKAFIDILKMDGPLVDKLSAAFPKLSNGITKVLAPFKTLASFLKLPVWGAFLLVVTAIVSVATYLYRNWDKVVDGVKAFFKENIVPKLQDIKKHLDKTLDALGPLGDMFKWVAKNIIPLVGDAFELIGGLIFKVVGGVIATAFNVFVAQIENIVEIFSGVVQVVRGVIDLIVAIFTKGDVGAAWKKIWDGVVTIAKGLWGIIKTPIVEVYNGIISWFKKMPSGIGEHLDEAWKKVKDFFKVSEWKKKVTDVIDTIKKNFKMPSFPSIKLSVTWDKGVTGVKKIVTEALGLDGWPKLKWSTYATGGFPSMGEMFIAREAGPELVGRIGSRSTVANNDQIVTAVSEGVYAAVRSAMSENGNGGSQNINVYLDSKQIHASVKRTDEARGRNIMGNQLGYLY